MKKLIELRNKIDEIDRDLISLFAKRMKVVNEVGSFKKERNLPALAPTRWQEVLDTRLAQAKENKLNPEMIAEIWNIIHKYALLLEENEIG